LLAALALVAYLVQPGDTLSGIAAAHGASLAAVETANSQIHDFDLIFAGQTVHIPEGSSAAHSSHMSHVSHVSHVSHSQPAPQPARAASSASSQHTTSHGSSSGNAATSTQSSSRGSSGYSSGGLSDIPGVPSSFAACVAYRESTNLQNPAANGNAYGIIPASGYNVYGTSIAHQKQVFAELYHQYGGSTWAADGCPGT
jgi:murein DD-endopeptidase MepM/ murein hydrolase activator NlpD